MHDSIAAAIRHVADDFPEEISSFLEVRYVDVSIGTQFVGKMKDEAFAMADSLVQLAAAVWATEEARG